MNYTVRTVAKKLGVCEETVLRWIKAKKIPAKIKSKTTGYRINSDDLIHFCIVHPEYDTITNCLSENETKLLRLTARKKELERELQSIDKAIGPLIDAVVYKGQF